jgi:hypothetical protein
VNGNRTHPICLSNCVAYVQVNMSYSNIVLRTFIAYSAIYYGKILIDFEMSSHISGKILYTFSPGDDHESSRSQATSLTRARCAPLATPCSQRSTVSWQRFLRSSRSRTGQIRDASLRADRRSFCQRGRQAIWILSYGVLSGTGRLSSCRTPWLDPQQTWSQAAPQTDRSGHECHRRAAVSRPNMFGGEPGRACTTTTRSDHSSPEHRTSPEQGRKKGATVVVPLGTDDKATDQWTSRYEALRTIARHGIRESWSIALVARQGVLAWMRAWSMKEEHIMAAMHDTMMSQSKLPPTSGRANDDLVTLLTSIVLATRLGGVA